MPAALDFRQSRSATSRRPQWGSHDNGTKKLRGIQARISPTARSSAVFRRPLIDYYRNRSFAVFRSNIYPPTQNFESKATASDYDVTALDDHGRAGSCSVVVR